MLGLHFFDGDIDQLRILANEYANNHELIIIVPKSLEKDCERIREKFFKVLPLDQDKIKSTLTKILQHRIHNIPAYSSGVG